MTPAVVLHNHDADPRPLKRARKSVAQIKSLDSEDHHFASTAPVDHIFIADGIANKKAVGKKTPLSCCECRRLKLKCDRSFPCASCKSDQDVHCRGKELNVYIICIQQKRGCAEICPDGVLVSGKGTRFILANTEQLHTKIHDMSERIRSLEDALHTVQAQCTLEPHPLLRNELLSIKSTMGLYTGNQGSNDMSTPATNLQSADGRMDVDSPDSGASEDTLLAVEHIPIHKHVEHATSDQLALEIVRLSQSFPLSDKVSPEPNLPMREYIRSQLPSREVAEYLWEQARRNALWQYNPHPSSTFFPNLVHHCYTNSPIELCPRRLALLFMILAVGCLVDLHGAPDSPDSEKYHQLARASLCEVPVMEETNVETITALFYEIWYLLVFSDKKKAAGYAWGLMGLTAKLAQSIGLHRNGSKGKIIPEEVEKRRSLFWELLYLDARLSLSLGRPPSLSINHMDCQQPSYHPDEGCDPMESQHYYQEWKHTCYINCLAPVLDAISKPKLEYSDVLDLDKRIRDFSVPAPLRSKKLQSRSLVMQKASLSTALEAVLLQLHRTFFTRALSGPEEAFNRQHKYAPSVVAVFLSASRMIATVQDLYTREPALTARILGYWSNAFSSAVALCLLVSRAPFTCLSPAALQELERARMLFREAKDTCPRAMQVIPILETMIDRANSIYNRWSEGQEVQTVLQHNTDELSVEAHLRQSYSSPVVASSPAPSELTTPRDSFKSAHRSLAQCIVEVHERARALYPMRKPCKCSMQAAVSCPPSHSWSPLPAVSQETSPVLPAIPPNLALRPGSQSSMSSPSGSPAPPASLYGAAPSPDWRVNPGSGLYSNAVLSGDGPAIPQPRTRTPILSPSSKMAVVDSINFELGALNSNSEQTWMAFW